ncbi:MAG: hypothetical protein K0M64_07720 [Rhizobium sp.]|nr:hypothetical protein [Rhizobium sp.]
MRVSDTAKHLLLVALVALPPVSSAYTTNITNRNPRAVYLRVGDGVMNGGTYSGGGTPGVGGAVAIVQASVPVANIGNGTSVLMTTPNNPRLISDWDGYSFCNSGQVYVGGFYRSGIGSSGSLNNAARLTYTAPATLVNANGQTIPISQISWTTSGNGDNGGQPIPGGTFSAGQNQLTTFPRNTWRESCLTFRYANQNFVASGTYQATVTFTLAQP